MTELVGAKAVAAALKAADGDLQREMADAIRKATAGLQGEIAASARSTLPGALGSWVAAQRVDVKVSASGKTVELVAVQGGGGKPAPKGRRGKRFGARADLKAINRGRVMHPVWGRGPLVGPQLVQKGFWDRPLQGPVAAKVKKEIIAAAERVAHQIAASGK